MLRYTLLLFFFLTFQTFATSSIFEINKREASYAQNLLKNKKAILIVSNHGRDFQYKKINSLDMVQIENISNKYYKGDDVLGIFNNYNIKVNGEKIDFVSTYIRDNHNKNKWIRLGSLVDPETFKNYLNDVYYTYTKKEKIPSRIQKNIQVVKNNGTPAV